MKRSDLDPLISLGLGTLLAILGSVVATVWCLAQIPVPDPHKAPEVVLEPTPEVYPVEDNYPPEDTIYPVEDKSVEPVPRPPRGRCLSDTDCRSGGFCVLPTPESQTGLCSACKNSLGCPGREACNDSGNCVRCIYDTGCEGMQICVNEDCVEPPSIVVGSD